jgi:hypothetical protein
MRYVVDNGTRINSDLGFFRQWKFKEKQFPILIYDKNLE